MSFTTKMIKLFAVAAIGLGLPAAAQAETRNFTRDGVEYEYTSTVESNREVLRGTADGVPFRFVIRGNHVTGRFGNNPVDFIHRASKQPVREDVAVR